MKKKGAPVSSEMKRIRVVLADDHVIVSEGLRLLLGAEDDIEICGEAATGRDAVVLTRRCRPDLVIMDIAMPRLNGLEAARQILQENPSARILMLSAYEDDAYLERAVEIGITGFLVKHTSASMLVQAIRTIMGGKSFFGPSVSKRLSRYEGRQSSSIWKRRSSLLSPREAEVLQLIAEGLANKQIAGELSISIKTVEKHRQSLMKKLDIHDTAGLTRHAIAERVIESSIHSAH